MNTIFLALLSFIPLSPQPAAAVEMAGPSLIVEATLDCEIEAWQWVTVPGPMGPMPYKDILSDGDSFNPSHDLHVRFHIDNYGPDDANGLDSSFEIAGRTVLVDVENTMNLPDGGTSEHLFNIDSADLQVARRVRAEVQTDLNDEFFPYYAGRQEQCSVQFRRAS